MHHRRMTERCKQQRRMGGVKMVLVNIFNIDTGQPEPTKSMACLQQLSSMSFVDSTGKDAVGASLME